MFYKTLLLTTTTLIYDAVWSHQKTKCITEDGINVFRGKGVGRLAQTSMQKKEGRYLAGTKGRNK